MRGRYFSGKVGKTKGLAFMIIVTGAAGFIGSAIVKALNDGGNQDILVVDHYESTDKWKNLRGLKYYEFIQVEDLFAHKAWNENKITAVYHMGACSDTTELNMDFLYKNNTEFTNKLFELCAKKKIPFLYASSAATYGAGEQGYSDEHAGISKLRPLNKYGYSKQLSDEWSLKQKETPPAWFGVKFFNVFGPNEYHKGKMSSVVFQSFNQIKAVGEVKLFKSHRPDFKDGEQLRDFVYVKDVVRAMIGLMTKADPKTSGIYNLGTGKARSFYDLSKATFNAMGVTPNITFIDMPKELQGQYQYFTEANMNKLNKVLPDFKFLSLEEAVSDYVKNHLMTEDPFLKA